MQRDGAPASLVVAKLMMPEVDQPETMGLQQTEVPKSGVNVFDAIAAGTTDGLKLAVNVGAMLIAFTALVAMLNGGLGWVGEHVFHTHAQPRAHPRMVLRAARLGDGRSRRPTCSRSAACSARRPS